MPLPPEDVRLFFRLHRSLMFYVSQTLAVIDEEVATPEEYARLSPETRFKVHKALLDRIDLIDAFADADPFQFDQADLEIVRSWKHLVAGTFYAFRQLQNCLVFLSSTDPVVAYGVVALSEPFEALIGPRLPRRIKTTLLPFKGRIIYDGLMSSENITFGAGIKRLLDAGYREARQRTGLVTSLPPLTGRTKPAKEVRKKRATNARTNVRPRRPSSRRA